jgi:hypothetical protein
MIDARLLGEYGRIDLNRAFILARSTKDVLNPIYEE